MKVFEIDDKRFDIALELFSEGSRFNFNDVSFYINKKTKNLDIDVISKWQLENLDEQRALEELERGKLTLNYLVDNSKKFDELIKNYSYKFSVIHDYGNGSVEVCYISNNELVWKI